MAQTHPSWWVYGFDNSDGSCTMKCKPGPVEAIRQPIHFDGGDGDTVALHGFNNRTWICEGYMIFANQAAMTSFISALESYTDNSTWQTLVDSFGNTWINNSRIKSIIPLDCHAAGNGSNWLADLIITGEFNGCPEMPGS